MKSTKRQGYGDASAPRPRLSARAVWIKSVLPPCMDIERVITSALSLLKLGFVEILEIYCGRVLSFLFMGGFLLATITGLAAQATKGLLSFAVYARWFAPAIRWRDLGTLQANK